jgi:Ser/Thr protein kinase RdoA (MazF antagonist)
VELTKRRTKRARKTSWEGFLNGYANIRKFEQFEIAAIPYFLIARQVWLMGLHASGTHIWGECWLDNDYFQGKFDYIEEVTNEFALKELKCTR